MKHILYLLVLMSSVTTLSAEAPPEALHFPVDEFEAFVMLSEGEFDTPEQWDDWVIEHQGRRQLPTGAGHYLLYTNDSILGPYNVFFGPYDSLHDRERDRARLVARVITSAQRRPSLQDAQVRLIGPDLLSRIKRLGPGNWARSEAMAKERSHRSVAQLEREVEDRLVGTLSLTEKLQLLATRNAEILDVTPIGILGQTLDVDQVTALDRQLGRYLATEAYPTLDMESLRREGLDATKVETLFLSLSNAVSSRDTVTWGWVDDASAGWAETELRAALYPSGTPEALSPEQADIAIRALGRLLPATAARRWGLSSAQILSDTPSQREFERVADRLDRHGASPAARMIQATLANVGPSLPDTKDIGSALIERFFLAESHPTVPEQDVLDGKEALARAGRNLPGMELDRSELDRWVESGATNEEVQRIADIAQRLIGDLPTIQAIGRSARSTEPERWTSEEVHDLIGRIGKAERQVRTAEALDENHDADIEIADAANEGATASQRQTLAKALGEAAGVPPAQAETKGEELLQQAGANPSGGVTGEQVASAAEAAAAEGGHSAAGEPGDANDGGTGDRGGSGAIPVQSLPVLEMIARLLAQYFGVEAYVKQAALLVYMFAGDVVKDLVAQLEGLNDAFGDDLNNLAQDVNALLDAMGPYMGDIGALADKAVEQGIEKATAALADLATAKFEEAAVNELKRRIADELGVAPSLVDIEGALSMASDFSMAKLTELAETAVEEAARDAAEGLLMDAGLPADVLNTKDWDAAGENFIAALKERATSEVSRRLGLDEAIAGDIAELADAGSWTEVGAKLVDTGRDRAIKIAAQESGLPPDVLSDPSAVPDKVNQVVQDAGSVALFLGDALPGTTKELMDLASAGSETIAARVVDKHLGDLKSRNPNLRSSIDAYQEGGLENALEAAKNDAITRLSVQTESLKNAVALAAGERSSEVFEHALNELQVEGALDITAAVAGEIKQAANPTEALNEHVFNWASKRWTLKFENDTPCRSAVDARDASTIRTACTQWLNDFYADDTERSIEAELAADPRLIQSVKYSGDRVALAQVLLQYAVRTGSDTLPGDLSGAGWEQVSKSGLAGAITAWSGESAVVIEKELSVHTNTTALQAVFSAVKEGSFDTAAKIVFENRKVPTVRGHMPPAVLSALDTIEDTANLLDTISRELRQHATRTGLDALRRDNNFGSIADVALCVGSEQDQSACSEHSATLTDRALNVGLADQNADLRRAILTRNPTLAAESQRAEIEASVQSALDGESLTAAQCLPTNDPGCVFRETQLIPKLREKFPDLSEEAARKLVADPKLTLPELKGFAAGALSEESTLAALDTSEASLKRFASTPSVLNDPDAQQQLKQSLLTESLSSVVGEDASRELLSRMSQQNDVPPEGHCVDVLVRAFIPSADLSKNNPIVRVPGTTDQWMIPGPFAEVSGYKPIPLSSKARSTLGNPSPAMLRTCYVGDNRGYSSDPRASSRVWVRFTMRVGESAFELDSSSIQRGTHKSHSVHCETGEPLESAQAASDAVTVDALPASGGLARVKINLAGQNPLIPTLFSPMLELEGTFTYSRESLKVDFDGKREAFPAYEAYARLNGGDWRTVFTTGPEKDASAFSIADYGILNSKIPFTASTVLPGLSSACRVPQDDLRRQALRRAATAAFKKSTNHCVTFTEVMKMAADRAPDLLTYLEDLRLVLIGSDVLRRDDRRGPYYVGPKLTNDTGFKPEFLDNSPQVEHAMWGIYAGKGFLSLPGVVGGAGTIMETAQGIRRLLGAATEDERYRGMSLSDITHGVYADSLLYAAAEDFAQRFLTTANYRDSYRMARKGFCATP